MRRYLLAFAASFAALLGSAALIVRIVNPYGYWPRPEIGWLSRAKPMASRHLDAVKHAQYRRLGARTLLAGNSRVAVGFDPLSAAWPEAMRPVYNFGQPGEGLVANVATIIAAAEAHRPDTILLGLDFPDFRVTQTDWRAPYRPAPLGSYDAPFRERWAMALSLDAVEDAVATIAGQHARFPGTLTAQGFDGLADLREQVATEGHAALFRQKDAELIQRWRTQPRRLIWPGVGGNPNWAALDQLGGYARSRGIALRLFTYPYHEDFLLALGRAGLGREFRRWRGMLAAYGDGRQVAIVDFTAIEPITTEAVPPPGDTRSTMRWYWEAGHFKAALGDRMIPALTGRDATPRLLTPTTEPDMTARTMAGIRSTARSSGAEARLTAALDQHH